MFLFAFAVLGTQAATVATVNGTGYETLEAAIAAAEPVDGVVTYEICGKAEVSATGWIQVLKRGLSNVKKVAFVGTTEDAEICIAGGLAILADQQYDIDVSFRDLKLSKPNPEYGGDYGHSTKYFTTWLRNTGAAENTVTYENCTFPNGACNNQYGKTVYTNCTFENGTTGLYNLWIYGGSVEMDGGVFTGTRGMKVYTEGTPATAPSVEVKGTAFSGLTEKAAIVVSKAATVKFAEVSVADCQKGLFQKDIEGSSDDQKVTVTANGSKISGSFAITANREPETAKTEFNITGGMFTAEVPSDYCADGFTVKATTDADGNTVYGVVEKTELVNYVTLELVFGDNVADEDVVAAKALYAQEKYETCKTANEAYMALFGVTWGKGYLDVTDNTAPLYKYAGRSGSVSEVRFYIHGTLAGFTSLQSSGNQIDCTVGGNHQISRTSYSIIGVDGADGKAKLTDGNVQAYVAGGYASMFTASGKLTIDNIEFTSTTSTTVGASATRATESDTENEVASAEMEIKNCTFRGRLYVYDNFENQGKMTYSIHNCVFDGSNYSGDSNAYAIFAQCKGGNNLVIKDNAIAGFARGINIDHANVHATIEKNTISVKDAGRSCIQLSSLATADIVGNTLELTGGNAITLHENLLTLSAAPKVSISGNKVTGKGYLVYDDAVANGRAFTSANLKLTYATDNVVAETVNTTQGVKDSKTYGISTAVNNEVQHYVATVGTSGYPSLAAAFAALSAEKHTLTLLNENAWDAATPVYWAAGTQSGYAATLTEALTAAYKANAGAITIVCRPGADVGTMTHGHVADDLTIYGNDAFISGGECDLEVDQYKYSRATGAQAADGAYLEKDITITAYELDNLGVWGDRHTAHMVTVNLTDCDGKAPEGNVQRVYISGTTGVNDITLTDCDFLTKATAVYSNADGAITAVNCSFTGGQVPFNINHKANGTQTVAVENCTFTNCGDAGDWKQFAAPLRLVNSGAGTQSAVVTGCAFADTVGTNGDILLGDGRTGQASNDVELKVVNTAANIQAQKPGYYGVETVDATKKATAASPAEGTLETSVAKLLPVDPRTLGYATSGKAEALPATPDMNGEVVNVTAAQAQYVLDGAYGPIDGKTINFTESINDTLILGRASKYDGSKTVYRHGSHAGEALSYADFIAYKNQSVWTESCYYERTVENVTFTANEGVTVKNFEADGGAHIYAGTAPVYDYVRDTGSWVTEGSCYYKRAILKNITFKGLTFKAKTDINTSESTTVYDGFTFKDCTFDLGTTADGNQAIRYYNENNNGNVKNLVVEGCTFKTCSQGVYTMQVKGITVKDSTFTQTGHNAIAIQSQGGDKGPCNHGEVVITGNTMVNIGDRAIRFNVVAAGTTITITGNTAAYGDGTTATDKQCIKAESLAEGVTTTVELNNWNNYAVAANKPLTETVAKIGTTDYKSLEDATEAAQGGDVITIVGYTSNMTAPDGWKFETADGVTTLVADPVLLKGADGKFHIASCDDLLLFRKMVNEKGMYFLGETVVLDKDIDMASVENWTPIGNASEKKFAGTFDGQNHTISGLKITGGSYVGLFGYLGAATVQNVALVGANVSGVKRVGALVGQIAGNATIKNCSLDATSSVAGSDSNTGGLIGEASGSIIVTLENLTNNAPVTNTESGTSRAAGILCQATSGASVTLKNCVNKGTITTNGGYAGGIVSAKQGGASLVFDGCSNTGTLANGTKGTGALLAWSCNGSSVTISNYSGDVANAIGWLSQDNYDHVFVINGVEHYIRVAKGGSGYTFASRYEAAQLMNKSYLQEIIGFFNYAKTVNPNFEGYPATPVEVFKSAYSTSDESIKGSLFNTDVSSGWPQLLSAYNVKSGKSLTADDFAVTWGTRDVLFMVSDPVTVVVTDTASAQAALDAATPNTTIIFKSGTYEPLFIRQTLEKSTHRSDLDKDGSYPAYLRSFKNLTLIAEVGAEVVSKGITAEAGLFWHASAPASNQAKMRPMGGFISYLALENVTIDGIAFDSTEQSAVTLRDNGAVPTRGNIMVDGLTIQNCTGRGVASNENIHFLAAGGGTNDQNFPGTEKKSFNNIVVKNCELDSYYQPIAFNNATAVLNGLTVTGNTFSNNGNSNVLQLSNKVNSGAFVIKNNQFKDLNGRVVRATNSTANWTITGNRLDKPIMYDDSGDLDLVKISVKAETVGAAVTESENDWNTGTLANGTYIANGDPALLPVARIGENKYYHSLQAAFDAAKTGDTVKLLADVTVAGQLVAEKALTLDLGGKTVTSTYAIPASLSSGEGRYALLTKAPVTVKNGTFAAGQARALGAYANLTLTDAAVTSELTGGHCCVAFCAAGGTYTVANATIKGDYAIANFAHNATIAITGSALEGSGCGLYHNGSNYGLKLTVSDTTINGAIDQAIGEGKDPSGVYLSGSLDVLANAENQNGAKGRHQATFTRCTIKGNTGVEVKYTDLTLEDCTVVATTKEPSYTQNNNGMAALGFAVVSTDNATGNATPKPEGTITITGADGSYTGLVGLGSLDSVKTGFADFEDAHYAVSGGTFSDAVLPEYCAAGFIPTANDDGTYGVKEGAYVAEIGTVKYETVDAAMEAAAANETATTVKLLAESVDETVVPTWYIKGDVTVDADSAVKATFAPIENAADAPDTDGMAYIASDDAEKARTITVGEKVTLSFPNTAKETGAFYIGYGKDGNWAPTHLVLNGRIEAYEPYIGAGSSLTVSKTGSLKSLSECLLMRRGSTVTVTGTDGAWSAEKPQVALGYGSQQGGEVTFKDTFVTGGAFWTMWNRNGNADVATKLTLDNTAFTAGAFKGTASSGETSAYQVELKNGAKMTIAGDFAVIAEGAVTIESGSLLTAKSISNAGTLTVRADALTDAVRVVDYTGMGAMTLADYGTVKAEGGELYVEDNDLWIRRPAVAEIGTVKYATLAAAIAAAQAGETVTLLADITLASKQSISKELTLDLNGKTLTGTAYQTLSLGSGANVTIQDSSAEKTGKVANGYEGRLDPYTICLDGYSAAALTLVSGTVEANPHKTDFQSVAINTNYKKNGLYAINIKGGKVFVPESSTNGRAIVAGKNVTLTVEGGEIVGGLHGVDVYGGSTTAITGGSISARVVDTGVIKAAYGLRAIGTASVTIGAAEGTADVVSVAGIKMDDDGYKLDVPAVTVNSGTIAGPVYSITKGTIVFNVQATSEDVLRFADDTAAKFLPSNLELRAKDIDGKTMYYVAAKPVAAIGAIGYETLEAALAAAKDGETVKLLADVTESVTIAADRTLTLDLNGKTLSAGKASEALTVTGHLTIDDTSAAKSGRVVGDGRYAVYMNNRTAHVGEAAVGGSLTLNAGSLEGATYGVYIRANQAAFTMNGGKVSATQGESIRVNNDYHAKTISLLSGEVGDVFLGSISSTELTTLTVGKADQTAPAAVKVGKIGLQYNRGQFRLELYNGLVGELPEIGSCTATYTALGMLVKSNANCPSGKVFEKIDYNGEPWYRIAALQKIAITFDNSKTVALPFATDWLKAHVGEGEATWTTEALETEAANGLAKWQCYLFGLDPNKKDAKVVATAGQGTDEAIPLTVANADASASPLVTGGYVTVAYVLMGSNDGTAWTPVATSDERDGLAIPLTGTTYKFYRVDVTVTSAEGN